MPNWTHGLIVITWKRAERASQHFTAVVWFVELPNNSGVCCIANYRWWMVICDAQPLTLQRRPYSSQLQLGYTHTSVFCFLFLFQRNAFLRAFWKRLAMDWPSPSVCTRNESLCLTKAASLLAICRRLHVHPNERSTARQWLLVFERAQDIKLTLDEVWLCRFEIILIIPRAQRVVPPNPFLVDATTCSFVHLSQKRLD